MLDDWYRELRNGGLAPATIRQHHAILSAAYGQAYRWDLVETVPTKKVRAPSAKARTATAPTPEEVLALITAADEDDPRRSIVLFLAASTGARRGELCRVRRSDIDLVRRRITIRGTKTEASNRIIHLNAGSVASLKLHFERQAELAARVGVELDPDPYLCAPEADASKPFHPDNISHFVSRLTEGRMHIHQLRHFQATQLLGGGLDAVTVAGRLGHASARTTLGVYAHFIERRDEAAADLVDTFLAHPAVTPLELSTSEHPAIPSASAKGRRGRHEADQVGAGGCCPRSDGCRLWGRLQRDGLCLPC